MSYFNFIFYRTEAVVETIAHHLSNPIFGQINAIVGAGLSGTMILIPVHQRTGIKVCPVRKKGTKTHSGYLVENSVEGPPKSMRYVIIDDFISSGDTISRVQEDVRISSWTKRWECVGIILYQQEHSAYSHIPKLPTVYLKSEVVELDEMMQEGQLRDEKERQKNEMFFWQAKMPMLSMC